MPTIHTTTIRFPELKLHPSAGHKLRGYFGNLFKERSPLLHNHLADGHTVYRYPLVQYKIIDQVPILLGLREGGHLLAELFLKMQEVKLDQQVYPLYAKNITTCQSPVGVAPHTLFEYSFKTLWMCLNDRNYARYMQASPTEQATLLQKIWIGNVLSFFKGVDHQESQQILARLHTNSQTTQFKNQTMLAFSGKVVSNVALPAYVGLGKSVARGYGAMAPAN